MKFLAVTFALLTSFAAYADLLETVQTACETGKSKKLQGSHGNCRVVVNPSPLHIKGSCEGKVIDSLSCKITFDSLSKSSHIQCGEDPLEPEVDSELAAEFTEFRVASIITKKKFSIFSQKERTYVINDPVVYKEISTIAYNIYLEESTVKGKSSIKPSIFWINDGGNLEFQDVKCELTSESAL